MSRKKLDIHVQMTGAGIYIPEQIQITLYRIAQESLNNVAKHARASDVHILLDVSHTRVLVEICDDGRGFDTDHQPTDRLGLQIMRERALAIGADFEITSSAQDGTRVYVCVPTNSELAYA